MYGQTLCAVRCPSYRQNTTHHTPHTAESRAQSQTVQDECLDKLADLPDHPLPGPEHGGRYRGHRITGAKSPSPFPDRRAAHGPVDSAVARCSPRPHCRSPLALPGCWPYWPYQRCWPSCCCGVMDAARWTLHHSLSRCSLRSPLTAHSKGQEKIHATAKATMCGPKRRDSVMGRGTSRDAIVVYSPPSGGVRRRCCGAWCCGAVVLTPSRR